MPSASETLAYADCERYATFPVLHFQHLSTMADPKLTRYELELMDILWRLGEGTVQDVCDELDRPLAYTTVMTTLRLLHGKKNVLKRFKRGRAHVYRPLVSRDAVGRSVLGDLQGVLFRGQLPSLMLGMLETGKLSLADVKALQAALKRVERSASV
jgi:BlaI family transcriptional regulator, penicillinase repressor